MQLVHTATTVYDCVLLQQDVLQQAFYSGNIFFREDSIVGKKNQQNFMKSLREKQMHKKRRLIFSIAFPMRNL